MKKEIKKLDDSKVELVVGLDKAEFQPYWDRAYEAALSKVEIKGFRKGSGPKEMLDTLVNKDKVLEEALSAAAKTSLSQINKEEGWTIIDQPRIELLETKSDAGVKYKADITLFPKIKLANYKKLAKKILAEKKEVMLSEEDIKKSLDYLLNSRAKEIRVSRAAKEGDLLEVDVDASCESQEVPGAKLREDRFILGQSKFIPGFDEKLLGKKEGEELKFKLKAPQDFWQKEYASKELDFQVKLRGVFERELPKLDDEFAQALNPQFKTVEDLKKSVKEGLSQEKETKERERVQIKLIEKIAEESELEIPKIMVERMLEGMVADTIKMLGDKVEANRGKIEEEMRKQYREEAQKRVKTHLVIYQIAKEEKLKPSSQEVEARAKLQNLDLNQYYDYVYGHLQNKKVFDFLSALGQDKS